MDAGQEDSPRSRPARGGRHDKPYWLSRLYADLSEFYNWTPDQIGMLTMYQTQLYHEHMLELSERRRRGGSM